MDITDRKGAFSVLCGYIIPGKYDAIAGAKRAFQTLRTEFIYVATGLVKSTFQYLSKFVFH